jgi:hypothetical protein
MRHIGIITSILKHTRRATPIGQILLMMNRKGSLLANRQRNSHLLRLRLTKQA